MAATAAGFVTGACYMSFADLKTAFEAWATTNHCTYRWHISEKSAYQHGVCSFAGESPCKSPKRKLTTKKCGCSSKVNVIMDRKTGRVTLGKLNFVHDNGCSPGERQAALMARRQGGVSGHLPNGVRGMIATKVSGGCSNQDLRRFLVEKRLGAAVPLDSSSLWAIRARILRIQAENERLVWDPDFDLETRTNPAVALLLPPTREAPDESVTACSPQDLQNQPRHRLGKFQEKRRKSTPGDGCIATTWPSAQESCHLRLLCTSRTLSRQQV